MLARSAIIACGVLFVARAVALSISDDLHSTAETLSSDDPLPTDDPLKKDSPFRTQLPTAFPTPSAPPSGSPFPPFNETHHTCHRPHKTASIGAATVTVTDVVTIIVGAPGATTTPPAVKPLVHRIVPPPFDTDPCADRVGDRPTGGIMPKAAQHPGGSDGQ